MNFFDYIKNDLFFKPFTLKYRRIYYDCIQILIDKMKELPVLYESDARDSLTIYLKNIDIQKMIPTVQRTAQPETHSLPENRKKAPDSLLEKEEKEFIGLPEKKEKAPDSLSEYAAEYSGGSLETALEEPGVELQASSILVLFRECGWLRPREIGRSGEYVVNVSTDCRRVMDFLRRMTEKAGEGTMSNRIFSMYEIMKSAFDEESVRKERPYTNILVPMIENETELKNELTDLKDNISDIMKAVIAFQDMNSFGQFIMKDEMLDRFFSEYFFVKNNGLIPTQISFIKSRLRILRQGEMYERMASECSAKLQMSMEKAQERVEQYFAELQYFLSVEYEDNMELIDNRINSYYNLANTRIMLMASNGIRLESALNDFLNTLSRMSEQEQGEAMEKAADCTRIISQKYVGSKSFERSRRIRNEGENTGLPAAELSEEEKQAQTEALFESAPNRYSVERVGEFLDMQMEQDEKISIKEKKIKTKEEILMYAAAMLYANNEEFPYEVRLSDEMVRTETADITNVTIVRK